MTEKSDSQSIDLSVKFHEKQTQAFDKVNPFDPKGKLISENRNICYGGARGGGKSFWLAWVMLYLSQTVCDYFKLNETDKPIPIGFIGRQRANDFDKTTFETIKEVIPSSLYRIRDQKKEFVYRNRVKWFFGGLDNQDDVSKFTSMELLFILLDQAEEIDESDIGDARGALRRKINGKTFPTRLILTANPRECWLKQEFIPPWGPTEKNYYYIQALPNENPHLPEGYLDILRQSYKHDQQKLKAMLDGDWDVLTGARKLVTLSEVQLCYHKNNPLIPESDKEFRLISIDPARFGDDKTVIYLWLNGSIKEKITYGKIDHDALYGKILDIDGTFEGGSDLVVMDESTIGSGLSDRLNRHFGDRYLGIDYSKGATTDQFSRIRHELWYDLMVAIKERTIAILEDDKDLIKQLVTVEFDYDRHDRWQVEHKDTMKDKLKRSPDEADAASLGVHGLKWLQIPENEEKVRKAKWKEKPSKWAMDRRRQIEEDHLIHELTGTSEFGMLEH